MSYNAIDLARYIISKCSKEQCPISNLQLQKILYYIQVEWLLKNNEPLFNNDICAWQFGPVVPDVYYLYNGYGASKILSQYDIEIPDKIKNVIDPIIVEKRTKQPWDLVEDTHRKNGAWDTIYNGGQGERYVIPIELLKKANCLDSKTVSLD